MYVRVRVCVCVRGGHWVIIKCSWGENFEKMQLELP